MKLIKSKAELIIQKNGINELYKHIEKCSRVCYKSEDKITESSAKPFVDRMIKSKHYSVLEHGTVYLKIPNHGVKDAPEDCIESWTRYKNNPYSKCCEVPYNDPYELFVTTNFRVLQENDWLDDLQYICEPTGDHEKRYTFKLTTDRGVSHELVRHRVFSFAQESTRYCNYSKSKFDNEITFIIPSWLPNLDTFPQGERPQEGTPEYNYYTLRCALGYAEEHYFALLNNGCSPQQARQVLPNALKTEIVMTGFESDWKHFFNLRLLGTTGKPHPDMLELAELMHEQLKQKGIEL